MDGCGREVQEMKLEVTNRQAELQKGGDEREKSSQWAESKRRKGKEQRSE